ncbi:MAG: histidinol dehydrogenase [Pirellulales bacterium]|nr:histidinol dehydrogenase [Pirellulales bacterium]
MSLAISRIDARGQDLSNRLALVRRRLSPQGEVVSEASRRKTIEVFGEPLSPPEVVARICSDVRQRGLAAVLEYTQKIDGVPLTGESVRVAEEELRAAHARAAPGLLAAVRRVRANIVEFQTAVLHRDVTVARPGGVLLRERYLPLQRVGICVPGGAAAYPSTVLMTAVPAQAAGVQELAVVAPPTPYGANNPDLLATCYELGLREVYRVGGAQGVAALAYGVEGLPRVDKIVGPGNLFVALAKKYVFGEVGIDMLAGPSEIVVIADQSARPDYVAADMLAQAEHAPGASVLITWLPELLDAVLAELERQAAQLARASQTIESLQSFGALVLVDDAPAAARAADELAPEHLHLYVQEPQALLEQVSHAGAIFLGPYSPVALGDYAAGSSHVLPTSGTARFAGGLSANDFLRHTSVIHYTSEALRDVADDVRVLATVEGLTAHRASIDVRLMERGGP